MSRASQQVLIVGGGIAGSATALQLASAGLGVTLVEKSAFPRDKPCGEGLLPHGVEKLTALGLHDALDDACAQPFAGILYRAHGAVACGDFEGAAQGRGVRRRLLDDAVQRRAIAAGATLVRGTVRAVTTSAAGVAAELSSGERLTADFVVGADGPRSRVRHALGLDGGAPTKGRWAIRRHFRLAEGVPLPARVEVTALPGHELYLTPVAPGLVGLAALCERDVMREGDGALGERLEALIAGAPLALRERLAGAEPDGPALACGPLRVRAKRPWAKRALLVGDAAGYVDAITGEGMSLALSTSELAARALREVLQEGAAEPEAFRRYARARARIFRDHALLTHGLVFLARHPALARRAIGRLGYDPPLFTRLLAVNDGRRTLLSLGALDLVKLGVGRAPPPYDELEDPSGKKRGLSPMASA